MVKKVRGMLSNHLLSRGVIKRGGGKGGEGGREGEVRGSGGKI